MAYQRLTRVVVLVAFGAVLARPVVAAAQQPESMPPTEVHEHVAVSAPLLTPTRETSGTAWLPPVTPMYGVHRPWREWDIRLNGAAFGQALFEPRDRHRTGGASTRRQDVTNPATGAVLAYVSHPRFNPNRLAQDWTMLTTHPDRPLLNRLFFHLDLGLRFFSSNNFNLFGFVFGIKITED